MHVIQFTTTSAIHISEMDRVSLVFLIPVNQHKRKCIGRPKNQRCLEAFQCVLDYLDSADVQQVTVSELVQLVQSKLTSEDTAYTAKYMKQKAAGPLWRWQMALLLPRRWEQQMSSH